MSTADVTKACDELHAASKVGAAFEALNAAVQSGNRDPEILWRLARAHYDLAQETTVPAEKHQRIEKGLEIAKAALETSSDNWAAHK